MVIFLPIVMLRPCLVSRELAQLPRRCATHLPKSLPTPYNIYVELNNQPLELLQTMKELKDELQTVKIDNYSPQQETYYIPKFTI